jgi:hypothetical protein
MWHPEILDKNQEDLLPFIQSFAKEYYLVGGTAIALQIGHRTSIDFDLFKIGKVNKAKIKEKLTAFNLSYQLIYTDSESFHVIVNGVKITFFQYPFKVVTTKKYAKIKMPDLLHLAAMKAYALGRRAKWKDYVDLFLILKNYHTLEEISKTAKSIFGDLFSPKMFRQQICYFDDIDYTEEVSYITSNYSEEEVKFFLLNIATQNLE